MTAIFWLTTGVGIILGLFRVLSQTGWWQRKEYRFDRVISVLTTPENRTLFSWPLIISMAVLDIGWLIALNNQLVWANYVGSLSLFILALAEGVRIAQRGIFRPKFTVKAIAVIIFTLVILLGYLWLTFIPHIGTALQWTTLIIFIPGFVAASVLLINIPFTWQKHRIINRAHQHRKKLQQLTVLGITGSYGKTSTKFFLQHLLQSKSGVMVTAEHRNSAVAVAIDMMRQLTDQTRLYIAEMGAYRPGEIRELASLTQPKLGLITAIGNQHLALFGSQERLLAAKWELMEALPSNGVAILNANDNLLVKKGRTLANKIIWYAIEPFTSVQKIKPQIYASNIQFNPLSTSCSLQIDQEKRTVTLPLASEALLGSTIAAVAAAYACGAKPEEIYLALETLKPYRQTMEIKLNRVGATIIDDSYSGNEHGTITAINHIGRFTNKSKIIVLTPLIELGQAGEAVHERIGKALALSGADVFLTNSTYSEALLRGGQKNKSDFSLTYYRSPLKLKDAIMSRISKETVILLEGRLPSIVRHSVLE